jgi:drug/metabolite transporter (DMT)-like permease
MLAGVLVFVALYNFARSLKTGAVSIVVPVYRLSFAITVVLAVWLLDEPLTGWKIAGLAASLVAVWLLLGGTAPAARASGPAVARVLVATLAMGVVSLVYKFGTNAGGSPATILAGQAAVFLPLTIVFALIRDRGFRPPPGAWRYSATAALLFLSGLILLITGLQRGQASVLVPVAQLSFVVTVGLGLVFMRETLTRRKALGLAFAVAALVCLTRS